MTLIVGHRCWTWSYRMYDCTYVLMLVTVGEGVLKVCLEFDLVYHSP